MTSAARAGKRSSPVCLAGTIRRSGGNSTANRRSPSPMPWPSVVRWRRQMDGNRASKDGQDAANSESLAAVRRGILVQRIQVLGLSTAVASRRKGSQGQQATRFMLLRLRVVIWVRRVSVQPQPDVI